MLEHSKRIAKTEQRLVMCRLLVDIMRTLRAHYMPANEPFGTRIETKFVGLCVAIGDLEGKPFSVAKIATYMGMPRTTVTRRLERLESWGIIERQGSPLFYPTREGQWHHGDAGLQTKSTPYNQSSRQIERFRPFPG